MKTIKLSVIILTILLSFSCKRKSYSCKCTYHSGVVAGQEIMDVKSKSEAESKCDASNNSFKAQSLGTCEVVTN